MTINAPAALLLLLYELVAEDQGVPPDALRGTVQNDILKEYIARGNYIFPPRPSMRLTTDLFAYCAERLPRWNTISISGYHIREAGSSAVQELAFTIANGIAYCEAAIAAGLPADAFGERLSFFFNAHNDFFQEVAKFRAARRLWAGVMAERFGATNPRALALRFHAQTGGSTLTAQQPENNVVRVAIQALSAVCGGAQSLHTNSFDEALALPSEHAATLALRTQQVLAAEAGVVSTVDPLGGSYYVEALTDELEARARELIARVDELGGAVEAIEAGWVQGEIEAHAYAWTSDVEAGRRPIVGVNAFAEQRRARRSSCTGSTRASSSVRSNGPVAFAPGAMPPLPQQPLQASGRRRGGAPTCCRRSGAPCERSVRWASSARSCARSGGPTTSEVPAATTVRPLRILLVSQMYPGPADPDLGAFVAQLELALRERGHELELAVIDRRAGGKRRYLDLRRRVRAAAPPDVVWAHFLVPAGLARRVGRGAARRHGPWPRRAQRRRDPRHRRADAAGRPPGDDRDRRLRLPPPRARAEGAGRTREDGRDRLRRRPRAVPAGASGPGGRRRARRRSVLPSWPSGA